MSDCRPSFLFLTRSLTIGGAERQLVTLALGLARRGHRITIATFYGGSPLEAALAGSTVRLVDLGKRGRWDVIPFLVRLIGVTRRTRATIIYSFLGLSNILSALIAPFTASATAIWSYRSSDMDLDAYDWLARLSYRVECRLSKHADIIIANSQQGRDHAIAHGFPAERVIVVYNGIDTQRFRPDAVSRARCRGAWRVTEGVVVIGTLARVDPMKGHRTLLDAIPHVVDRVPNTLFVCAGDGSGSLGAEMRRHATELGIGNKLRWLGRTSRPEAFLSGIDIYCSPSLTEGFPNAVAEAMASGALPVVTSAGDSAAIVGDTGFVVPTRDPLALAEALVAACRQVEARDGRGRQRVVDNFSTDALLDKTLAAARLVENNGAPAPAKG